MKRESLVSHIFSKKSCLCIGLDPDMQKIPAHLLETEDPIFEFNKAIIEATHSFCVAYKPNSAFYEAYGLKGWESLAKTIHYLNIHFPHHFTIADAKRGDIGNTSAMYAKAFLQEYDFDSITVAPYMGSDSVKPFLSIEGKWVILLALTSNEGAYDFQMQHLFGVEKPNSGKRVFEKVLETSSHWGTPENMMYVVGATKAEMLHDVRKIVPEHFLLVPGVGAQGGSLEEVMKHGMNSSAGLLINSSRAILYAGKGKDFADKAAEEAYANAKAMAAYF